MKIEQQKTIDDFSKLNKKEYLNRWREQHPEHKEKDKKYRIKNNDKILEYHKKYRREHIGERKKYNLENKKIIDEYNRKYHREHKKHINERHIINYNKNPNISKEYGKKYREEHPEWQKEYSKRYREEHPEWQKEYSKRYYKEHKIECNLRWHQYYKENKEKINAHKKEYRKNPIVKSKMKEWSIKYNNTPGIKYQQKERWKKYTKTENGREAINRVAAKRRNKKWIKIFPNIFPKEIPVDYHHIDGFMFVSPIPRNLHVKSLSGKNVKKHIEQANDWIEFYYGINPIDILKEDLCVDVPNVEDGLKIKEEYGYINVR